MDDLLKHKNSYNLVNVTHVLKFDKVSTTFWARFLLKTLASIARANPVYLLVKYPINYWRDFKETLSMDMHLRVIDSLI